VGLSRRGILVLMSQDCLSCKYKLRDGSSCKKQKKERLKDGCPDFIPKPLIPLKDDRNEAYHCA
jgi:hypothetical protein